VRWDDPDIGIDWLLAGEPELSTKDAKAPTLHAITSDQLSTYEEIGATESRTP